ncbi:MAG: glucokinase [Terrimicrobiaceae bacterium]
MPASPIHLLAGDVGGTKTNLALFLFDGNTLVPQRNERYHSSEFPSLNAILRKFLGRHPLPLFAAGFGVPGPVKDGCARPTNLTWAADEKEIAREFNIPHVAILNDLAANAYGISQLAPTDFATLQEGAPDAAGNRCVVSPGTGLGEAGLYWDGRHHRVWACEGGHTDFAPRNDLEIALLEYLIKRYGHVSIERVASGLGIPNIYEFLRDTGRGTEKPQVAAEIKESEAAGAVIARWAQACPMCAQTMEIFITCLAAEAGNMALKSMATGGVYLGGGIPVKILPQLQGTAFLHAFNSKGRLSSVMESMPVKVILNDQAALLGAARYALDLAE